MKNYIDCKPIMLDNLNTVETPGLRKSRKMGILSIGTLTGSLGNIWIAQHLYLVSEQEIKEGDWYIDLKNPERAWKYYRNDEPWYVEEEGQKNIRKIIATTDKSLSLPLIPDSFIERWVRWQGDIDKVRLKMENPFENLSPEKPPVWQLALDKNDFVIIFPIEDKTYSRDEVKEIRKEYNKYLIGILNKEVSLPFDEWFDKNYPI